MKRECPKFIGALLCFCLAICMMSGCGNSDADSSTALDGVSSAPDPTQSEQNEITNALEKTPDKKMATLYIGNQTADYTEYPLEYEGEATPEMLLQGIADLTGWDLTLADEITSGKGGMTVVFGPEACLFTGPPVEQKNEFHVYDSLDLTFLALDSIQKTLQNWASSTNPESVDIYFAANGDQPMELTELGVTWPLEQPYSHYELEALLMQKLQK